EGDRVILTSVALERKYLFGEIFNEANEILDAIESYYDYYFPYAQHGALLYSVLQRINLLASKTYYFSIDIICSLFDQFIPLNEKKPPEDKKFLILLQLLLKTAVESSGGKSEILQLDFLVTGLPRVDIQSLSYPSTLTKKPIWIQSDLIWFDIVSLSTLFNQDDHLHHLSESILENDQQWKTWYDNPQLNSFPNLNNQQFSQIEKLLIIRLLCPEHFINALAQYVVEQFDLNTIQINDFDFQGVNIITLPKIFLLNQEYQENF
ncbi:unnamed protein product, partial [Adineta steineri]